ncbi:hypothetical protein QYF61_027149 [Mycteria americana]|uniref:RNase H type-1 domain-containing protein n=1 Tax=Mycteria americana TaxID=33587 RepID=A0AAN7PFT1_MYCAM|nr:hypothetical protein QYF61_027149 [Mycteria americana]
MLPPLAAVLDMLELQYELGSKAAKWHATTDIANARVRATVCFHLEGRSVHLESTAPGVVEQGEALEYLHYVDDIVINNIWGNTAAFLGVLLLAPRLPVLGWMFKGRVPSTHRATDATWSKWVPLITQWARIGNPRRPGILEAIMDCPEGKDFGISPEQEVTRAEETPLYNKLPENEKQYALFTDGSCRVVGKHRRWKAAVWSPIRQVVETAEGDGESSQSAEAKAMQLALDIAV